MIGYDFDGVIITDILITQETLHSTLNLRTNYILPLFQPQGKYVIITGRPVSDYPDTMKFIKTRLKVQPEKVWHSCPDMQDSVEYKASVLLDNPEIHTYVESCSIQSQLIYDIVKRKRRIKIIHFASMIRDSFKDSYYD